jgi:hypothetical protein
VTPRCLRALLVAAMLGLVPLAAHADDPPTPTPTPTPTPAPTIPKKTLLTTDGTLWGVRTGTLGDMGDDVGLDPATYAVEWSAVAQDGSIQQGVLMSSASGNPKTSLDLTFDEVTGSFVILWREDAPILNQLHLAVMQTGVWSFVDLVPNMAFPQAFNPQMLLSHQTITTTDDLGNVTSKNRSILSIIWWEEAAVAQARYAPIFLDEPISTATQLVYDLPATIGGGGPTSYDGVPASAYLYPSLHLSGPGGGILASFTDLNAQKLYVVHIDYPTQLGNPSDDKNLVWQRRRIPVVGVTVAGPLDRALPETAQMSTLIGSSYNPTLYWKDDETAVRYTRFDGKNWSDIRTIALSDNMSYDAVLRLLEAMAARN